MLFDAKGLLHGKVAGAQIGDRALGHVGRTANVQVAHQTAQGRSMHKCVQER